MDQTVPFSGENSGVGRPAGVGDDGGSSASGAGSGAASAGSGTGFGRVDLKEEGGSCASNSSARQAYWDRQRRDRNLSGQLVFATKPPAGTEEIIQPDPSISGELLQY